MFVPEGNFKFFVLEKQIDPLCTGGCEKLVYIAEILVTLGVLRSPARFFLNKMCSFDMRDSETTVLVTLYTDETTHANLESVLVYHDT